MGSRVCSRTSCRARATTTLTYVYADQTAVIGPLSPEVDPASYDLCDQHSASTSAPRGWETIRMPHSDEPRQAPLDDLLALADAIREVGMRVDEPTPSPEFGRDVVVLAEKRHLKVIAER
ncbi:DUF3499 family protein [Aestuariimicrobium sp. T2.26MG-19.2B]|uniref:DUF3499 family protein n=1 Tax=Aestuariimicrobium sp. T2.26MG-19.2B TaxID=3040679 RepID=UPI002477A3C3|nr:DUF3499 family protein [Aestuariimicrobium sp. T2.26MG-19.2B]CAI9407467.1 hypothetical protein AESSP_01827 [Aestuariimicrobium sp. T2.26MG-19.2B]